MVITIRNKNEKYYMTKTEKKTDERKVKQLGAKWCAKSNTEK